MSYNDLQKIINDLQEDADRKEHISDLEKELALHKHGGIVGFSQGGASTAQDLATLDQPSPIDVLANSGLVQWIMEHMPEALKQGLQDVMTMRPSAPAGHASGGGIGFHQPGSIEDNMLRLGGDRAIPMIMALHKADGGAVDDSNMGMFGIDNSVLEALEKQYGMSKSNAPQSLADQIPPPQERDIVAAQPKPEQHSEMYNALVNAGKDITTLNPFLNLTEKASKPLSEVLSGVGNVLDAAKLPPVMPELNALEAAGLASGKNALSMFPELADKYLPAAQPHGTFNMGMAYHGSPHKFEKFDASKIGTGEGAQAYGHGLYFAESPKTAATYSHFPNVPVGNILNKEILPIGSRQFADRIEKTGSVEAAKAEANHLLQQMKEQNIFPSVQYDLQKELDLANQFGSKLNIKPTGATPSLYTVDIPDEHIDRMLDWDKPLSKQHPDVQAALRSAGINILEKPTISLIKGNDIQSIVRDALKKDRVDNIGLMIDNDMGLYNRAISAAKAKGFNVDEASPGEFIEHHASDFINAMKAYNSQTGASAYQSLMKNPQSYVEASDILSSQGIPGIKYLDQSSRDAGEGTRNFVVFPGNEHIIKTLYRNGEPINP